MFEAERIGELNAVMVIPRPLDEMENTLPLASCWIEHREPLNMPINVQEQVAEIEVLQLPDLSQIPAKVTEEIWQDE
jgi:carbon dioxide concentrating mechanism protein CcmO